MIKQETGTQFVFLPAAALALAALSASRAREVLRIQKEMPVTPMTRASAGSRSSRPGGPGIRPSRGVETKASWMLCFTPDKNG